MEGAEVSNERPTLTCACCGNSAPQDAPGWDLRRDDDLGEPLIWPFLDDEEKANPMELWGRCPICVGSDERMPLPSKLPPIAEALIYAYKRRVEPLASKRRAFAQVWHKLRDYDLLEVISGRTSAEEKEETMGESYPSLDPNYERES